MRRVFPLKSSENCTYDRTDSGELLEIEQIKSVVNNHAKANKEHMGYSIDHFCDHEFEPNSANNIKPMKKLDSKSLLKPNDSSTNNVDSGDENLPSHHTKPNNLSSMEISSKKPTHFAANYQNKPQRASAYPVFTASSSGRYSSLILNSDKAQENVHESARMDQKQQRNNTLTTFHRSLNSETNHAKDFISTNKIKNIEEMPRSVSKDRPFLNQQVNLGASSVRTNSQLPDWIMFRNSQYIDEEPCSPISDTLPPRPRSLSRTTSERSYSETSSDFSSCFTRTTESSSGRSMISEAIGSKKSSTNGKGSGAGNAPFKYLNARMVAEKLVKVLGKEKLHWQSSRPVDEQATNKISNLQGGELSIEGPAKMPESKLSTACHVDSVQIPTAWFPQKDVDSFDSIPLGRKRPYDENIEPLNLQSLEERAVAREKLAAILEQERSSSRRGHMSSPEHVTMQDVDALKNEIRKLHREKRDLALEVACEIRTRMSEKKSALYAYKCKEEEMEGKVSAIEREMASLRESLEREIERRSEEWQVKLSKIKTEERKMKERITEMAEERNELQKMIASFKAKEASWIDEAKDYENSISVLQRQVEESVEELMQQRSSSEELTIKLRSSDAELENVTKRNKCVEIENAEMQKELTRLRRVCNDQEMSIEGLWHELDEAVNGSFECKSEHVVMLQRELLRLARAEQVIRNEANALHSELSKLREERGCDLPRHQPNSNSSDLNHDWKGRLEKLQAKVDSLQEENKELSLRLKAVIREKEDAERAIMLWQSEQEMEKEKNSEHIMSSEEGTENVKIRILESKLTSREEEVDRLDKEVDKLVNSRDSLQIEVDDLHEKLCIANHQIQELGKKIGSKEEMIEALKAEIEKHGKEKIQLQNELPQVRKQRDEMGKEAEEMSKEVLRLTLQMSELRKVTDKLEEEVMLKDGQISILRGSYTSTDCGLS